MTPDQAVEYFIDNFGTGFYDELVKEMSSAPIDVLLVTGNEKVVEKLKILVGPNDFKLARSEEFKDCLRSKYALNEFKNGIQSSLTKEMALRELKLFFPSSNLKIDIHI